MSGVINNDGRQPGGPGAQPDAPVATELKVGDKVYTPEKIAELEQSVANVGAQAEKIAALQETAKKYDLTPEELARRAEGAFGKIFHLMEMGILDEQGNVIKQEPKKPEEVPKATPSVVPSGAQDMTSVEAAIAKALGPIQQSLKQLQDNDSRLFRDKVSEHIKARFPDFDDEDVSIVVAKASTTRKPWEDVAKDHLGGLEARKNAAIESFAKEHGLNIEQLNKLKEIKKGGGSEAQLITEGRKVSFRKGKSSITPRKATAEYLNRVLQ